MKHNIFLVVSCRNRQKVDRKTIEGQVWTSTDVNGVVWLQTIREWMQKRNCRVVDCYQRFVCRHIFNGQTPDREDWFVTDCYAIDYNVSSDTEQVSCREGNPMGILCVVFSIHCNFETGHLHQEQQIERSTGHQRIWLNLLSRGMKVCQNRRENVSTHQLTSSLPQTICCRVLHTTIFWLNRGLKWNAISFLLQVYGSSELPTTKLTSNLLAPETGSPLIQMRRRGLSPPGTTHQKGSS